MCSLSLIYENDSTKVNQWQQSRHILCAFYAVESMKSEKRFLKFFPVQMTDFFFYRSKNKGGR